MLFEVAVSMYFRLFVVAELTVQSWLWALSGRQIAQAIHARSHSGNVGVNATVGFFGWADDRRQEKKKKKKKTKKKKKKKTKYQGCPLFPCDPEISGHLQKSSRNLQTSLDISRKL